MCSHKRGGQAWLAGCNLLSVVIRDGQGDHCECLRLDRSNTGSLNMMVKSAQWLGGNIRAQAVQIVYLTCRRKVTEQHTILVYLVESGALCPLLRQAANMLSC